MKIKTKAVNNTFPFAINISLYYEILHLHQQLSHAPSPRSTAVRPNHTVTTARSPARLVLVIPTPPKNPY
jgi:hypothetical protein